MARSHCRKLAGVAPISATSAPGARGYDEVAIVATLPPPSRARPVPNRPNDSGFVAELAELRPDDLLDYRLFLVRQVLFPKAGLRRSEELVRAALLGRQLLEGRAFDDVPQILVGHVDFEPTTQPPEPADWVGAKVLVLD